MTTFHHPLFSFSTHTTTTTFTTSTPVCVHLCCLSQVNFNEPISFLQRSAEDLTYSYLLDRAATQACSDPAEQLAWIAAFVVSSYASTAVRTGKPFNPLLGETFELDRSDDEYGWRLIAEQVCGACFCSAPFLLAASHPACVCDFCCCWGRRCIQACLSMYVYRQGVVLWCRTCLCLLHPSFFLGLGVREVSLAPSTASD